METELTISEPPVVPGKKIKAYRYKLAAFRLHKMLEQVSRMQIALIECDSNNTSSEVTARDSRNFIIALASIRREWEFAIKHKDAPVGTREYIYQIALVEPGTVQRMKNQKLKSVALELQNFGHVCLGSQAADTQVWVGNPSETDLGKALGIVEEVANAELGTGKETDDSTEDKPVFDTGALVPDYSYVGELKPPPHEEAVIMREPSSDAQPPNIPDVPDVE